ncbi:MAG: hypothetical protein ACYC99_10990 [Candidatus Geothermincolia bacterium]
MWPAKAVLRVTPTRILAPCSRAVTRHSVRRGRKILAKRSACVRVIASTAAPFARLDLEIGDRLVTVEMVPWLAWFRSSIYSRALSRNDLVDLSRRFSSKVKMRVIVPPGLRIPVASYPGAMSDATGEVLEWLIGKYIQPRGS